MKPKNLQEFIEQNNYDNMISGFLVSQTAKHLLEVAKEKAIKALVWNKEIQTYVERRIIEIEDLESYCAPMEDLKEHAKKRHDDHKEAFEKLAKE